MRGRTGVRFEVLGEWELCFTAWDRQPSRVFAEFKGRRFADSRAAQLRLGGCGTISFQKTPHSPELLFSSW